MSNKIPKQAQRLLAYMETHDSVTQIDALNELGIMRLASRISELKDSGYLIKKKMVTISNRYGEKCSIAKYSLVKESEED